METEKEMETEKDNGNVEEKVITVGRRERWGGGSGGD